MDLENLSNPSDLWARVISNIYGAHGGIFDDIVRCSSLSPWGSILKSVKSIKRKGIDLLSLCTRKIRNGDSTKFWHDIWCGDQPLKLQFPCIFCSIWIKIVLLQTGFLFLIGIRSLDGT
ncbi:hypothetical protein CTI12_AA108250 [Artemisia annua]|uniref:RNA-directed DNA polymerase, eukaryota, Reverse transcriptase zinc-binding domain protein n=1 Tax=Artemisia annua TaxID=35608 RepID=A0A2U1PN37_ARTAN|nr:hypothetical protein CTI12_AA108250 [Artemisia annua]